MFVDMLPQFRIELGRALGILALLSHIKLVQRAPSPPGHRHLIRVLERHGSQEGLAGGEVGDMHLCDPWNCGYLHGPYRYHGI